MLKHLQVAAFYFNIQ